MNLNDIDSEELQRILTVGNEAAVVELMSRYRQRLKRMVQIRMDQRLSARFDASDVVQEALAVAANRVSQFLRERPLPLYPWLRQITWERLVDLHHHHLSRQKRSVVRERRLELPNESAILLANRLIDMRSTPSQRLLREEMQSRVRSALTRLSHRDRDILVMRHLEHLSVAEIAEIEGLSESGVKMRNLRAITRLRALLENELGDSL